MRNEFIYFVFSLPFASQHISDIQFRSSISDRALNYVFQTEKREREKKTAANTNILPGNVWCTIKRRRKSNVTRECKVFDPKNVTRNRIVV